MNCLTEQYEIIRTLFELQIEKVQEKYLELIDVVYAPLFKYDTYDIYNWYDNKIEVKIGDENYDCCEYLMEQYSSDDSLLKEIEHNILHKNDGYFELFYNLVSRLFNDIPEIYSKNYFKDIEAADNLIEKLDDNSYDFTYDEFINVIHFEFIQLLNSLEVLLLRYNRNYKCILPYPETQQTKFIQPNNLEKTSFNSSLNDEQLKKFYIELNGRFIDSETNFHNFEAIFKAKELYSPVLWILKAKNKSTNKNALIDLFSLLAQYKFLPEKEASTNKKEGGCLFEKLKLCFRDSEGKELDFTLSNKSGYSSHYKELEEIVKSMLNIPYILS